MAGSSDDDPTRASGPGEVPSDEQFLRNVPRIDFEGTRRPALGRYALFEKLGQGGMGVVYHGVHTRLGTEVAIKVLPLAAHAEQEEMIDRFCREARFAANLRSEHLVGVLDVAEDPDSGFHFIVMEYVKGMTADQWMRRAALNAPIPEADALEVCIAATQGLTAAHLKDVIHRDVKPGNILIPCDETGAPQLARSKLADLGLARSDSADQGMTRSSLAIGTPGYMAPEQAKDAKRARKPADVFSMGATLYGLLTGSAPFAGTNAVESILKTVSGTWTPLSEARPDVSAATAELVAACLAQDPACRFPDAPALLDALGVVRAALTRDGDAQRDAATSLRAFVARPEQGAPVVTPKPGAETPAMPSSPPGAGPTAPRTRGVAVVAIVITVVSAGLFAASYLRGRGDAAPLGPAATPHEAPAPDAASGTIVVSSTPDGATVLVDGEDRGSTPVRVSPVTAGDHVVKLVRDGCRPWSSGFVTLSPGETLRFAVPLERSPGTIDLSALDADVVATIAGARLKQDQEFAEGTYVVFLTRGSGYRGQTVELTVKAGAVAKIRAEPWLIVVRGDQEK